MAYFHPECERVKVLPIIYAGTLHIELVQFWKFSFTWMGDQISFSAEAGFHAHLLGDTPQNVMWWSALFWLYLMMIGKDYEV